MEITIRYDPASSVPAVRQIADNLRVLLVERSIDPGASLPSVRRLAMELGVHFNTVADAYRQLAQEGWLTLKHGQGATVVARESPPEPGAAWVEDFSGRVRGLVAQMRAQGVPAESIAAQLRAIAKAVTR